MFDRLLLICKRFFAQSIGLGLLFTILISTLVLPAEAVPVFSSSQVQVLSSEADNDDAKAKLRDLTEIIQLEPSAEAYNRRCLIQIELASYTQAQEDCTSALNLEPDRYLAHLNLGLASYRLDDYLGAIASYNQALKLKPYAAPAYYNRGLAFAAQEKYLQAITDYNQAIRQTTVPGGPQLANIYNDRGIAYLSLGNLSAAIQDFDRAIHLHATNSRSYYNRACACAQQKQHYQAIRDFTKALQLNPQEAQAYVNRGMMHYQLGHYKSALADLRLGAECFCQQGKMDAYQKVQHIIAQLEQKATDHVQALV